METNRYAVNTRALGLKTKMKIYIASFIKIKCICIHIQRPSLSFSAQNNLYLCVDAHLVIEKKKKEIIKIFLTSQQ